MFARFDFAHRIKRFGLLVVLFLTLVAASGAANAYGSTTVVKRYVSPVGTDANNSCLTLSNPCKTINHALFVALTGDTISVAAGRYAEHLAISKNITIRGASLTSTVIDGGAVARVVDITSGESVTLAELTIQNGKETGAPGGAISNAGTLTLRSVIVSGNSAVNSNGGGIWNQGTLTVDSSFVVNNHADGWGGGIYNQTGALTLEYSSVSHNTATIGGGIYNAAAATLKKDTLTGNTVSGNSARGGGLDNFGGTVTLTEVTFTGNSSADYGGGMTNVPALLVHGNATLTNVTFNANSASLGGGLANFDAATLNAVTFDGNAGGHGSGFYNLVGNATLTNVTFSENAASFDGGGLENGSGLGCGTAMLINVTFSGNASEVGGGLYNYCGTLSLKNTIVANSLSSLASNGNCDVYPGASITSLGHNLDSGNSCGFNTALHDLVDTDPLLETLAPNGGYTETFALEKSSPAIDAGTDSGCPAQDQRGKTRITTTDPTCDIGAYEYVP